MALSCQWSRARLCACALGLLFPGKEARQRSLPPPLLDSVWKGTVFGASGGSRDTSRSWETGLFFHLQPPRSSHSVFFRPPPHPRFSPACHSLIAVRRRRARRQRCLVIRARRTFPASRWVWGSFKRCRGDRRARFGRLGLPDVTGAARTMRLGLIRRCPPRLFSARSWKGCSWPSSCLRVLLDAFFYLLFLRDQTFWKRASPSVARWGRNLTVICSILPTVVKPGLGLIDIFFFHFHIYRSLLVQIFRPFCQVLFVVCL